MEKNPDTGVQKIRDQIDDIDNKILCLLAERLERGRTIGAFKKGAGLGTLDPSREKNVLARLVDLGEQLGIQDSLVHRLYTLIIAATRAVQNPVSIAFLGPEATNTHIAALDYFNHVGEFVSRRSILDIFQDVEKERCTYGVVPVENSMEGAVNSTLDLLFTSSVRICGEICMDVSHALLSQEMDLSGVKIVYSHPQAIAQSREWLREHLPLAKLAETSSTAMAAQRAASEPGTAAIAAPGAASLYRLYPLASRIEGSARNATRFLVIGREEMPPTGRDKTTLIFVTSHIPGALHQSLAPMAEAGVNLVKLESRPSPLKNWHYFFVTDFEGHAQDEKVGRVISAMEKSCLFLKNAGSYPVAFCKESM